MFWIWSLAKTWIENLQNSPHKRMPQLAHNSWYLNFLIHKTERRQLFADNCHTVLKFLKTQVTAIQTQFKFELIHYPTTVPIRRLIKLLEIKINTSSTQSLIIESNAMHICDLQADHINSGCKCAIIARKILKPH